MSPDWHSIKIGDLGKIVTGKTPPSARPECFGNDYPFITPSDIGSDTRRVKAERYLSMVGKESMPNHLLPERTICVVCIGATIGKICMTHTPSFTNQQINSIIVDRTRFDPHFVYYAMRKIGSSLLGLASGAATPIINKSSFSDVEIVAPALPTQRRIASILSAYDDLIENNTRRIAILEEMARRIYEEWFVRFRFPGHEQVKMVESELGLIPEGWELKRLGDVVELAYGKALKAEERKPGPYPVYGSSGVVGSHDTSLANGPGIIVGRKGNVGSVHWCDVPFYPIDTVYFVRTELPLHYVFFNLRRQNFINNDAAVPGLNRNQAYSLHFLVPSEVVLGCFVELCGPIFKQIRLLAAKNTNLRATRDLLLPKLISGELDVAALSEPEEVIAA